MQRDMKHLFFLITAAVALSVNSCERLDDNVVTSNDGDGDQVMLSDVAEILSQVPLGREQVGEVFDAVSSSAGNGYDEEYLMSDLFKAPGSGVGDDGMATKGSNSYGNPLRSLIEEYVSGRFRTKAGDADTASVGKYLRNIISSGMQIYWPYSDEWDGTQLPVITFDPGDGSERNEGYKISVGKDGVRLVEKVIVDEKMAQERPVWVINNNDDSSFNSLQVIRRTDPEWGTGGGSISLTSTTLRTLVLKSIKMNRNYDSWFAGASEFFVKCGSVDDFSASTESEMKLYSPTVTDFMIVVKRRQKGIEVPFNVVLVSDWTDQLESCAFMVIEDDGGTKTTWKCSACVKIKSKSYGFDISIPFNSSDDIVWRGQLSRRYFERYDQISGHFGDVDLTFQII